jgi:hypothetical protein
VVIQIPTNVDCDICTQGFSQQQAQQSWSTVSQAGATSSAAAAASRLSLQQQQNPMLNAQLTVRPFMCVYVYIYNFESNLVSISSV